MSLKVISLLQAFSSAIFLHLCFYFSIHFSCYMYVWYVQIKKILTYLLTYLHETEDEARYYEAETEAETGAE